MFTLLKVVGERARSPTTFVMITNQKCQLYRRKRVFKIFLHNDVGLRIIIYEYSASHIATLEYANVLKYPL